MSQPQTNPRSNLQRQIRAIREGRGQGRGVDYRAFIQIRRNDFSSQGRSHYWPSAIMARHHDLLSDLERAALLRIQLLNPIDIREQYPLSLHDVEPEFEGEFPDALGTVEIAAALNARHPRLSAEQARVMTTDLLVNAPTGQRLAVYVKYSKDLLNERKQQLLAIESRYWHERGTQMTVFTEEDVNKTELGNLLMFASATLMDRSSTTLPFLQRVAADALHRPMKEVLIDLARHEGVPYPALVDRVKWACATGRLRLDLTTRRLIWSDVWPPMVVGTMTAQGEDVRARASAHV
jgi:hypothetical protein